MTQIQPSSNGNRRGMLKGSVGTLNAAGGFIEAGLEFYNRRSMNPNESLVTSAGYAAGTYALWALFPGIMWGKTLGEIGMEVGKQASQMGASMPSRKAQMYGATGVIGSGFADSERAYTARQRGLQAIENSRMNARSALGNEARSLHRR